MRRVVLRVLLISVVVYLGLSASVLGESRARKQLKPIIVSCGICNSRAIYLPKPVYPASGKAVRASGPVRVSVKISERGRVYWARAVSGHILLRPDSELAARQARFEQWRLSGKAVRVIGTIVYNYIRG